MNEENAAMKTTPEDTTGDAGPLYRGGPLTYVVAFSAAIVALTLGLVLYREGYAFEATASLALFGLIALRAGWKLVGRLRFRGRLPRTHSVLTDHLGFRIDFTCHDVAMTAFLSPDEVAAGGGTRLLCFLENYASRQRVAEFVIGPHSKLGLGEEKRVSLHLAAGQAAVYVLPLEVSADLAAGEHDLPITMRMRRPTGMGIVLPGVRRHLHNLWTVHYATPFVVGAAADTIAGKPANGGPVYLSLGSVSEKEPRLEALQGVLG